MSLLSLRVVLCLRVCLSQKLINKDGFGSDIARFLSDDCLVLSPSDDMQEMEDAFVILIGKGLKKTDVAQMYIPYTMFNDGKAGQFYEDMDDDEGIGPVCACVSCKLSCFCPF